LAFRKLLIIFEAQKFGFDVFAIVTLLCERSLFYLQLTSSDLPEKYAGSMVDNVGNSLLEEVD